MASRSAVHGSGFATTRWSVVAAAGATDVERRREALAALCEAYWRPLHAYVRRRAPSEHDARDLTQAFFTRLIEHDDLAAATPHRGRFRAFLLTALKHFLANERDKATALKRGGGRVPLSLDFDSDSGAADGSTHAPQPSDPTTPEQIYQRAWVSALLRGVLDELRDEWEANGRGATFELYRPFLVGTAARGDHAAVAAELGVGEGAARTAVQRLRARYRELLRRRVAETVLDPADVDDEIASLFAAVRPAPRIA